MPVENIHFQLFKQIQIFKFDVECLYIHLNVYIYRFEAYLHSKRKV